MNVLRYVLFPVLTFSLSSWSAAAVTVADPRCEGLRDAPQVDTAAPRFSWHLESETRDTRQTAWQLRVTEVDGVGRPVAAPMESARVESDATQWVQLPGFKAKPRTAYTWQVRAWDNHGGESDWSEARSFATGLLGAKWPADWIGDGRRLERLTTAPARHFRSTFKLERKPVRARLFLSAFGLVEPWINGRPVTEDRFVPGWPDYNQRVFYVAYDVTALLQVGENGWGAILGDGWYSGTMLPLHQYGNEAMFSAFIDVTDADGTVTTFRTGKDWRWTDEGPIMLNSIYHGESYDARRERPEWSTPAGSDWNWREVTVKPGWRVYQSYTARMSPPVRRIETMKPASMKEVAPGVFQYDLGQNMVGWVRLKVQAPAGSEVTLRSSEMLDANGRIYTANLRAAKATARYTTKGGAPEEWEPRFTYFGFRYVEVSGLEHPPEEIEGVVVHTDLPRTGSFECSDDWLNRLYRNTLWGQKGNFLEIPTDCPQRDERLGWTGDTQIFSNTALYNMDAGRFYRQWLFSLRDSYRDDPADGGFADTAPNTGHGHGSAGWAEAGVIVPWMTWLHTGDRQVLVENMPAIQHFVETMASQAPDGIRRSPPAWGDWLAPGFPLFKAPPSYELIATAYYAHAADLASRMAEIVDRPDLAKRNRKLFKQARAAFQREYLAPDGRIAGDVQTSYLLALGFDLVPAKARAQVIAQLIRTFAEKDNHLSTGFLGTPLIMPVLTSIGRGDLAYTVLQQKTYPGWLFSVKNGATTIWERWDSWTPEQGFNKDGMNSFNHYAYGSVVGWFYDTIAGLQPLPEAPGWKRFRIVPIPGGGLTSASATLQTPHGQAASAWKIADGRMSLEVRIPVNTQAEIVLPVAGSGDVKLDGQPLAAKDAAVRDGHTIVTLPSGTYTFDLPSPAR